MIDRYYSRTRSNCAKAFKGGWWYTSCHNMNPNGLNLYGAHVKSFGIGINFRYFRGYYYSLKTSEMKLRKMAAAACKGKP